MQFEVGQEFESVGFTNDNAFSFKIIELLREHALIEVLTGALNGNEFLSYVDIEACLNVGGLRLRGVGETSPVGSCKHEFLPYVGLFETYTYCVKCDKKGIVC